MPVVTEELWSAQGVQVQVTYNTNKPDNITKATCINNNPFDVVLLINWNTPGKPITRVPVAAGASISTNPTVAEQADLNSLSVEMPPGV